MAWTIELTEKALKDLKSLDSSVQARIIKFLKDRVGTQKEARLMGKPLVGTQQKIWRYRVGNYRILCQIQDDTSTLLVILIKHRSKAYRLS